MRSATKTVRYLWLFVWVVPCSIIAWACYQPVLPDIVVGKEIIEVMRVDAILVQVNPDKGEATISPWLNDSPVEMGPVHIVATQQKDTSLPPRRYSVTKEGYDAAIVGKEIKTKDILKHTIPCRRISKKTE